MAVGGSAVSVSVNVADIHRFTRDGNGPIARDLQRRAELVTQEQKRLCPTSPRGSGGNRSGHLRSSIGWSMGEDGEGLYADVGPRGVDYWMYPEFGTKPHVIESKGNYPLRSASGQVFGRRVHHPGTPATPYIRPSILAAKR